MARRRSVVAAALRAVRTRLIETRLHPRAVCYLRPDCAVVALGPQSLAAHRFVTFERELPVQRRGGRDHRFVVIDWGDFDKSGRFHAYSQRRFVEDSIVQDLLLFLVAEIVGFHSRCDGDNSFVGP